MLFTVQAELDETSRKTSEEYVILDNVDPKNRMHRQSQADFDPLGQIGKVTVHGPHGEEACLLPVRSFPADTGVSNITRVPEKSYQPKVVYSSFCRPFKYRDRYNSPHI